MSVCSATGLVYRHDATTVLHSVDYEVPGPGMHAIVGPSGSGKTTLLNLLAGLSVPHAGSVRLCGRDTAGLSARQRIELRARGVGFVFQRFNLVPTLTARQNIELPLRANGARPDREWLARLTADMGVGHLMDRHPNEMSGGQQQRIALVRALLHRPQIVFADEPTGSLDTDAGAAVMALLSELCADHGVAVVLVTHDQALAARCDSVVGVRDGRLTEGGPRHLRLAAPVASSLAA